MICFLGVGTLNVPSQHTPNHGHDLVIRKIGPGLVMFATSTGNAVASVGADGVLLTGTPSLASSAAISRFLASQTKSPCRYVVIASEDPGHSEGDAGWQVRGAFVAMQENALGRLGGHTMGPPLPLPSRLAQLGVDRPRVSFSDVLSFDLNHEAIHFIHQAVAATTPKSSCISTWPTCCTSEKISPVTATRELT